MGNKVSCCVTRSSGSPRSGRDKNYRGRNGQTLHEHEYVNHTFPRDDTSASGNFLQHISEREQQDGESAVAYSRVHKRLPPPPPVSI